MLRYNLAAQPNYTKTIAILKQYYQTQQSLFGLFFHQKTSSTLCTGFSLSKNWALLLLGALLGFIFAVGPATAAYAHSSLTPNAPAASQALDGLISGDPTCGDSYRIAGTELCTHGPDEQPPTPVLASAELTQPENFPDPTPANCDKDGIAANRVQVMYVHAEDVPDRYNEYVDEIRTWAGEVDQIYDKSAHETNGHRHIRFVTNEKCEIEVLHVTVSATSDDSFRATIMDLVSLGYTNKNRKYIIFMDANVYCGIATITYDSRPFAENANNLSSGYGRVDNGCWRPVVVAHELTHILGGVQKDAPHSSGGGHCVDEWDLMCYSDTPYYPGMEYLCPTTKRDLLDCNHDDYFHTNPPTGTYLATHWNVANSTYLIASEEHHNLPPTVAIAGPLTTETITAPATITVTAAVSDSDGTVTKVEFYNDATLLATDDSSPYIYYWHEVASGSYTITAKAYDEMAASTTSAPLVIVVQEPPVPPAPDDDDSAPAPRHLYLPFING